MQYYYVYITTNPGKTTYYVGFTNNLERRLEEHYENKGNRKTFAGRYYCYNLLYYETFLYVKQAICREKEIKLMKREVKIELIKVMNPAMNFLKI
jgi:putative endonuclease